MWWQRLAGTMAGVILGGVVAILEFDKSWEVHGSQLKLATTDDDLGAMDGSTPRGLQVLWHASGCVVEVERQSNLRLFSLKSLLPPARRFSK